MLDRIHDHAATKKWRETDWRDKTIEDWLDDFAGKIAAAARLRELKLPVHQADLTARGLPAGAAPRRLENTLLVGKGFSLRSTKLRNCIILADGNVLVDGLEGCVVVARGAVSVVSSSRSVIVSGAYVRVRADGDISDASAGSLIISRGWANLQVMGHSIVLAPEGITTGSTPVGGVFINVNVAMREAEASFGGQRPRRVRVRDLPLGELPVHPLNEQLEIVGLIYPESIENSSRRASALAQLNGVPAPRVTGAVIRFAGRRYVVDLGKPIVNQNQEPVADLAGWRLSYLSRDVAIFSSGAADAVIPIGE